VGRLREQPFQVLLALLDRPGEVGHPRRTAWAALV